MPIEELVHRSAVVTMDIGVTSSRNGMDSSQAEQVRVFLEDRLVDGARHFHHGDCVKGDATAHVIAWSIGYHVAIHPPSNPRLRAFMHRTEFWNPNTDVVLPPRPYMERNLAIVNDVSFLLVVPDGLEADNPRSGTWACYRMARRLGVPTRVIMPSTRKVSP